MSHVRYIDKTREYYLGQGYEKPYDWAHFDDVPFATLNKPLSQARISLVSTSDVTVRSEDDGDSHAEQLFVGTVYSLAARRLTTPTPPLWLPWLALSPSRACTRPPPKAASAAWHPGCMVFLPPTAIVGP